MQDGGIPLIKRLFDYAFGEQTITQKMADQERHDIP